ncbi:MAG: sigma-54-dependent Fis family transcriptional regulator [Hyphomicrobiales bacterium]|nr:sigma-54-dependent Fis family transcriptional regulator [Hyphomicrobiales bacterium]
MTARGLVVFVDDDRHVRNAGRQTLELAGYEVQCLESAQLALHRLSPEWPGVVVSDIKMPGMDGLEFLTRALDVDRDLPVVLITGHGDISMAVKAIRDGAYDFIEKPFPAEVLVEVVGRAVEKRRLTLENRSLRREVEIGNTPGPRILGNSQAAQRLRHLVINIADTGADVLIHGETGTGKELVANFLHEHSRRRDRNFVAVNCGAVPAELIESELFGHEAGAFTGAARRRIGKFEHANGGTILLDEIESTPPALQVKLLRVLQERQVERLGSNTLVPLDLRVVAATKVDLEDLVRAGRFREDLYYRLNVVAIEVPPLRERRGDIPLLFQHFVLEACSRHHREPAVLEAGQAAELMAHSWPGNVRELQHAAERFVLFGEGPATDLATIIKGLDSGDGTTLAEQVGHFEKSLIAQELARHKGDIRKTMEALGVPRKTLYDKMAKFGLSRRSYQ